MFRRQMIALGAVSALACAPQLLSAQSEFEWQRIVPPQDLYFNGTTGRLNLRAGPGLDQPVTDSLAVGSVATVNICQPDAGWCVIQYANGQRVGWVRSENLTRIDGSSPTAPSVADLLKSARQAALRTQRPLPRPERQ